MSTPLSRASSWPNAIKAVDVLCSKTLTSPLLSEFEYTMKALDPYHVRGLGPWSPEFFIFQYLVATFVCRHYVSRRQSLISFARRPRSSHRQCQCHLWAIHMDSRHLSHRHDIYPVRFRAQLWVLSGSQKPPQFHFRCHSMAAGHLRSSNSCWRLLQISDSPILTWVLV